MALSEATYQTAAWTTLLPDYLDGSQFDFGAAVWTRTTIARFSVACIHPICFSGELERPAGNDPASVRWQRTALPLSYDRILCCALSGHACVDHHRPRRRRLGRCSARIGGKWTESNVLPRRDRVYSAAAAPACPYWHFPEIGCGRRIRTADLLVMSQASYRTALPRDVENTDAGRSQGLAGSRGHDPQCLSASISLRTSAGHSPG